MEVKQKTETEKKLTFYQFVGLLLLFSTLFCVGVIITHQYLFKVITYEGNFSSFEEALQQIQDNCGSTHITQQYGSTDWFVFTNKCIEGGYCKYDYIPLNECLKGGKLK